MLPRAMFPTAPGAEVTSPIRFDRTLTIAYNTAPSSLYKYGFRILDENSNYLAGGFSNSEEELSAQVLHLCKSMSGETTYEEYRYGNTEAFTAGQAAQLKADQEVIASLEERLVKAGELLKTAREIITDTRAENAVLQDLLNVTQLQRDEAVQVIIDSLKALDETGAEPYEIAKQYIYQHAQAAKVT